MTVATNALLEGRTARTALIATEGFTDVIELGRQARAHLYRLCERPPRRSCRRAALRGAGADGPRRAAERARSRAGPRARRARRARRSRRRSRCRCCTPTRIPRTSAGSASSSRSCSRACTLSLSSELVGTFREYERTATTAARRGALAAARGLPRTPLRAAPRRVGLAEPQIMQSSGGLTDAARAGAHAALTVLSGPAGGRRRRAAARRPRRRAGRAVLRHGRHLLRRLRDRRAARSPETAERVIAGRPLALPALDIHTVGAGGGSIAWRDAGGALRVGPASAGAESRAGLLRARRRATRPSPTRTCCSGACSPTRRWPAALSLDRGGRRARDRGPRGRARPRRARACAEGIVRVAEAEMLGALRVMTVERGIDPRRVRADALRRRRAAARRRARRGARDLARPLPARVGRALARSGSRPRAPRRDVARTDADRGPQLIATERLAPSARGAPADAAADLGADARARARVRHELRYRGQSFELPVDEERGPPRARRRLRRRPSCARPFARAHEQRYGYRDEAPEVELVNLRVSVWGAAPALRPPAARGRGAARRAAEIVLRRASRSRRRSLRGEPAPGSRLDGPALCALPESTLLVPPGWSGDGGRARHDPPAARRARLSCSTRSSCRS